MKNHLSYLSMGDKLIYEYCIGYFLTIYDKTYSAISSLRHRIIGDLISRLINKMNVYMVG